MGAWWVVVLAGLAGIGLGWIVLNKARRKSDKPDLREQVQTWEDEGGSVPDVPTVTPRVHPGARH
jgi:hypothetical protein